MKEQQSNYGTSQEVLYSACLAAWNLCSTNLPLFTNLKAFYTPAYVSDAIQVINNAQMMPDARETVASRKEARITLQNAARGVFGNWQLLKVYITNAFAPDMVTTKLEAAGASLYYKAVSYNWSAVRSLIDAANTFIAGNLATLTANQNMPVTFQAKFQDDGATCTGLSVAYAQVSMGREMATSAKIDANNDVYAAAMSMLRDGQQIFKDDAAARRQFVFNYLISQYRGEGSASLKGYIFNSLNLPLAGAAVLSADGKYGAVTDEKGYYRITRIASGTYNFNISCEGYVPAAQEITFVAGTGSKGDFTLANEMKNTA